MKLYQVKGIKVFNNREFAKKHQLAPGLDVISDEEVNMLVNDYVQRMVNQMNSHLKTLSGDQLADYVDAITETYTQTNISELILADPRMDLNELTSKINRWGRDHHIEEQSELLGISGLMAATGEMAVALDHNDQAALSLALGKVTMTISNIALRNKLTLNECLAAAYAEIAENDQTETRAETEESENSPVAKKDINHDAELNEVQKLTHQLMDAEDPEVKKNVAIELRDAIKGYMDKLSPDDPQREPLSNNLKMIEPVLAELGASDDSGDKSSNEKGEAPVHHHGLAKKKHFSIGNNPEPTISRYHPSTEKE